MKNVIRLLILAIFLPAGIKAQTSFYDNTVLQRIDLYFSQPNWDYMLDTSKAGLDGFIIADSVHVNDTTYIQPGVKYKGNSSYNSTYVKNPLHIALDYVTNQSYQGFTSIKLGNGYADPSAIREVLAYDILGNYMDAPRSNFAAVYVNGTYLGLFSNDESIDKSFCSRAFYSSNGTFFKCNPIVTPGPTTKSNLKFITPGDSTSYFNFYELKSTYGWNQLVNLCDTVTNIPAALENILDVDRALWMLSFNNSTVNLDSYTGVFCQNYYLYRDYTNRFNPIMWDLNMAFGGFPYAGSGATSMGSLTVANMVQLPPTIHSTDTYWPLINDVMSAGSSRRKQYFAHLRTIINEQFVTNNYVTKANQLHVVADTAALHDVNSFYTYSQFQNGLNTDYTVGTYTVPGITNLMSQRVSYLQSLPEYQLVPPTISNVLASNNSPAINSSLYITATVSNQNQVLLGFRNYPFEKFTRIPMLDDGLHGDGTAGDGVFGASVNMISSKLEYFIYSENNDAGVFSPARAEHEFYSLNAAIATATAGQVTLNELLAINQTDTTDASGSHEDWIELRNNTPVTLNLAGLYLSDDATILNKWAFPSGTVIGPYSYLLIWADKDPSTPSELHCNFKLAAIGEELYLSDASGNIFDYYIFGPQAADNSYRRCPNGTGAWGPTLNTTPGYQNDCPSSVDETELSYYSVAPNPTHSIISILSQKRMESIQINDLTGRMVYRDEAEGATTVAVDLSNLTPGIYSLIINNRFRSKLVKE